MINFEGAQVTLLEYYSKNTGSEQKESEKIPKPGKPDYEMAKLLQENFDLKKKIKNLNRSEFDSNFQKCFCILIFFCRNFTGKRKIKEKNS